MQWLLFVYCSIIHYNILCTCEQSRGYPLRISLRTSWYIECDNNQLGKNNLVKASKFAVSEDRSSSENYARRMKMMLNKKNERLLNDFRSSDGDIFFQLRLVIFPAGLLWLYELTFLLRNLAFFTETLRTNENTKHHTFTQWRNQHFMGSAFVRFASCSPPILFRSLCKQTDIRILWNKGKLRHSSVGQYRWY